MSTLTPDEIATFQRAIKPKSKNGSNLTGRPKGTRNRDYAVVEAQAPQCPKCGSTQREKYRAKEVRALPLNSPHRPRYTHLVRRSCRCSNCGQWLWVKTHENPQGWYEE